MRMVSMMVGAAMLAASAGMPALAMAAVGPSPVAQDGNGEVLEYCTALVASGRYPTLNFGECVSFNSASDAGFKTKFCDFVRETGSYADFGFTSYSDCVRNF